MNYAIASPQSVQSVELATEAGPDPIKLANLLRKGHDKPTYGEPSRESTPPESRTPYIHVGTAGWVDRIKSLRESIPSLSTTFAYETWRNRITDEPYWQIEADYWEDCCCTSVQSREKGELQMLQLKHFLKNANKSDWFQMYTRLESKPSEVDIGNRVLNTIYRRHRARFWKELGEKRGHNDREGIHDTHYWRVEFYALNDEVARLEEASRAKAKPAQRSARSGTRRRGGMNSRTATRGKASGIQKPMGNTLTGTRKSARLAERYGFCSLNGDLKPQASRTLEPAETASFFKSFQNKQKSD